MKKETVCAVVVTYNRKNLLIECLESLVKQTKPLDGIYLIDNASTDGTPELLKEKDFINELPPKNLTTIWEKEFKYKNLSIHYVRMPQNTGGAGGFHEGVKRAYNKGYDWLWLMDDDAEPYSDSLELLLKYSGLENVCALASSVIKPNKKIDLLHRGTINFEKMFPKIQKPIKKDLYTKEFLNIQTASFVGLLISRKIIKKIGFPNKDFFIHNDDIEYSIRITNNCKMLLIPQSKILHKYASELHNKIPFDKLWLNYFGKRNLIIIAKKYTTNKIRFYTKLFSYTIKDAFKIILHEDNKTKRIKFLFSQIIDGLNEIYDNEKPKKILYN